MKDKKLNRGLHNTQRLFEQLRKVIDLPENCRSLVLRMSADAPPTIETERFVKGEDAITERFRVVLIEDEKSPGEMPGCNITSDINT